MIKTPPAGLSLSLLFGGALVTSVFYQGFYTEFLCLTLALLVLWALYVLWVNYDGLAIPKSNVALCLTLYWVWLWVAGWWGRVGYLGTINAWWLSALPLVFWIYTLSPQREAIWKHAFRWAVVVGIVLAINAGYQWIVLHLEPSAMFLNRQSLAALLNLIAIPLCGFFLLGTQTSPTWHQWLRGGALFVLAFGIALIEGRGSTLSGAVALAILVGVAWRHVPARVVVQLLAIVSLAFLVASQLGRFGIGQRLEDLAGNPWEAGATRFVIWQQSWELLKQAPWMGIGLGHYALYWPPFRDPIDGSGGFFVHNDYLQIWIEAGLPGLLLLIAVLVSVLVTYIRALAASRNASRRIEMTALFAGLLAIAMHSFVDFNLHVLSILLLAGLMLGRLHGLALGKSPAVFHVRPSAFLSQPGYRMVIVLLTAFPLFYFATLSFASLEYGRGLRLAGESKWEEAYLALDRAERAYPFADNVLMSKADFLRSVLVALPDASFDERRNLFGESQRLLAQAEALNPLRPQTPVVRALLYQQNPNFAGADWEQEALRNYRRSLALEPRAYEARYLYASFLVKQGHRDDARQLLEDGMKYVYPAVGSIVPYYTLTAALRKGSGDHSGARELVQRIADIGKSAKGWKLTREGEVLLKNTGDGVDAN